MFTSLLNPLARTLQHNHLRISQPLRSLSPQIYFNKIKSPSRDYCQRFSSLKPTPEEVELAWNNPNLSEDNPTLEWIKNTVAIEICQNVVNGKYSENSHTPLALAFFKERVKLAAKEKEGKAGN